MSRVDIDPGRARSPQLTSMHSTSIPEIENRTPIDKGRGRLFKAFSHPQIHKINGDLPSSTPAINRGPDIAFNEEIIHDDVGELPIEQQSVKTEETRRSLTNKLKKIPALGKIAVAINQFQNAYTEREEIKRWFGKLKYLNTQPILGVGRQQIGGKTATEINSNLHKQLGEGVLFKFLSYLYYR